MSAIVLCLTLVVAWDLLLLKRLNGSLYKKSFIGSHKCLKLSILFLCLGFLIAKLGHEGAALFVLLVVFPYFFLQRTKFSSELEENVIGEEGVIPRQVLAGDAFFVTISWFYSILVFSIFLDKVFNYFLPFSELAEALLSAFLSSVFVIVIIMRLTNKFSPKGFFYNVGFKWEGKSWVNVFVWPAVIGIFLASLSTMVILTRKIQPNTPLSELLLSTQSSLAFLFFLVLALLIAPLVEEIIFRGYFYHVISKVKGKVFAVVSISCVFAFLHVGQYWGDWAAILMVAAMGFALTILRAVTGTTMASTVAHYFYNGGITIIPIIVLIFSNPPYFEYMAYYSIYDTPTKEKLLQESIKRQPDLADAYNELAWLYSQEEIKLEEALDLIEEALSYGPDNSAYLDTKAEVLEKLGRFEEARIFRDKILSEGH